MSDLKLDRHDIQANPSFRPRRYHLPPAQSIVVPGHGTAADALITCLIRSAVSDRHFMGSDRPGLTDEIRAEHLNLRVSRYPYVPVVARDDHYSLTIHYLGKRRIEAEESVAAEPFAHQDTQLLRQNVRQIEPLERGARTCPPSVPPHDPKWSQRRSRGAGLNVAPTADELRRSSASAPPWPCRAGTPGQFAEITAAQTFFARSARQLPVSY